MNKVKSVLFSAGISLALAFTFGCSSGGGGGEDGNAQLSSSSDSWLRKSSSSAVNSSSSVPNSSGSEQSYNYCIIAGNTCLTGPFTASTCTGQLSNNCPNGSSSSIKSSSSSVVVSSSSVQSSSSKGSSSSGGFSSSSSVNGQGVPFNENSQIYNENGTLYNGSGVIKIEVRDEDYEIIDNINAGSVTNGIVSLNLPSTIPDEYLRDYYDEDEQGSCTSYPKGIKGLTGYFVLINEGVTRELFIEIDQNIGKIDYQSIRYVYFSKAGKITCSFRGFLDCPVGGDSVHSKEECDFGIIHNINIDAKVGWNKVYRGDGTSTNNILTKEVRWTISK